MQFLIIAVLALVAVGQAIPYGIGYGGGYGGAGYGGGNEYGNSQYNGAGQGYNNQGYGSQGLQAGHNNGQIVDDFDSSVHHHQAEGHSIGGISQGSQGGQSNAGYGGYQGAQNNFGRQYDQGYNNFGYGK